MAAVFHGAAERTGPLKLEGYNPFMRGPLIRWQRAYDRYDAAAAELAAFDRDVHTPAASRFTALAAAVDQGDASQIPARDAAGAELDVAQDRYDDLCSVRYDALAELLSNPAPGPAELAMKLRLFSSDYGWTGGNEQKAAGEQMAIDARRFGRVGPFKELDRDILDSFDSYRHCLREFQALPDTVSEAEEAPHYALMDEASLPLCDTRAATIEGVIARLRFALHGADHEAWMPDVVADPSSERFKAGMPISDLPYRLIWQSIEDLARLGGVNLMEQAA